MSFEGRVSCDTPAWARTKKISPEEKNHSGNQDNFPFFPVDRATFFAHGFAWPGQVCRNPTFHPSAGSALVISSPAIGAALVAALWGNLMGCPYPVKSEARGGAAIHAAVRSPAAQSPRPHGLPRACGPRNDDVRGVSRRCGPRLFLRQKAPSRLVPGKT
jgi:hypothetical protein